MALRVTNQMMSNQILHNLTASMRRLDRYNQQLSTGKRINAPSDDPAGTEMAMRLSTTELETEQYLENVADGISWLNITDSALNQVGQALHRARELTVYGANDALSDQARQSLAMEVNQLIEDLVSVGNLTNGQKFLFSGENTMTEPIALQPKVMSDSVASAATALNIAGDFTLNGFGVNVATTDSLNGIAGKINTAATAAGADVTASVVPSDDGGFQLEVISGETTTSVSSDLLTASDTTSTPLADLGILAADGSLKHKSFNAVYNGTSEGNGLEYEIGPGITMRINVYGDDTITPAIEALVQLKEDLDSGNVDQLSTEDLQTLDQALDGVLQWRAESGARANRLELVQGRLEETHTNIVRLRSRVEDVDVAEAIMNLKMEENVYRMALASGARIIQPTLMDFLR